MKHEPTAADELAALQRGLDRHRRGRLGRTYDAEGRIVADAWGTFVEPRSKRPRHPGEEGEAESVGPKRGVAGPGVRELQS